MYSFASDYQEGAHARILETLARTNLEQTPGYSEDAYCDKAAALIRRRCAAPESAVYFFVGGTQTNCTVASAFLRPHQGVVAPESGHIAVHESGGIEASGHKVLSLPTSDGKLTAAQVEAFIAAHYADVTHEHMVQPGMVYISHPTEVGTVYTKAELEALHGVCESYGIPLYLDGARLGCALSAEGSDVALADLARLTDAFYIGGTKMGALFGEALVINKPALCRDFRYIQKQRSGRLAKGRLLGLQFIALFEDDLYFELASHANAMAKELREGVAALGYDFFAHSPTNQVFPIFPRTLIAALGEDYDFSFWSRVNETHDAIRLCTSWATPKEQVEAFLQRLRELSK